MTRRLRVTAGPSQDKLVPITVNSGQAHRVTSDLFDGEVAAFIKDFVDHDGDPRDSEYFRRPDRSGVTWSIQVRGRFLTPLSADEILFGNTFDRPFNLPWGTGAILKFMNYIDPTLEHDLQSTSKPWALSPLISTMPHFSHHRVRDSARVEVPFPSSESLVDNTSELHVASTTVSSYEDEEMTSPQLTPTASAAPSPAPSTTVEPARSEATDETTLNATGHHLQQRMSFETAAQRRSFFSYPENRQKVMFGPLDVITTDFCYGFLSFSPTLSLQIPGGISFDLAKYWDGQPVRFVCCERRRPDSPEPWGRIFWCVTIEMVDEDDEMNRAEDEAVETNSDID